MKKSLSISVLFLMLGLGLGAFLFAGSDITADDLVFDEEEATVRAIERVMPAVVSIKVFDEKNDRVVDSVTGSSSIVIRTTEVSNGTGFIISPDGFIITNRHVVELNTQEDGQYQVRLSNGKKYYAQFIGLDPLYDIALLKIFDKDLPFVELGDSDSLKIGVSVMAIGNSLGKYENSTTKGIISGLGRELTAIDGYGMPRQLDNLIQTDAEINHGNSGGPLINLRGEVVGVNVAMDSAGKSVGFALPINDIRPSIRSARVEGRIVRPKIGLMYMTITPELAENHDLPRSEGAWVYNGPQDASSTPPVVPGGPADSAGILDGDIIFEINAIPINQENSLLSVLQTYKAGARIGLKIQRGDKIIIKEVTLGEFR
jgi:S1-C subfamily serine protease